MNVTVKDEAPLLAGEDDHPHDVVAEYGGVRIVAMDSARYVDARNTGRDVVVAASYLGVLPARLMAPHHPRAVIGHDACIGADGAGIAGLAYLEALGIPAAAADGMTAELGNGVDLYSSGVISRANVYAERCGVVPGQTVREAAERLATAEPGDTTPGTKVRREVTATSPSGRQVVVTDSIVFALPEDGRNVLVTAGHTGRSGARFLIEVSPWGFICADGGMAKNASGIAGLGPAEEAGLAGACFDALSAPIGDAFMAYERGVISACNGLARRRGVYVGQPVREAAGCLLRDDGGTAEGGPPAVHQRLASPLLRSGQLAGISPKFAEGLARVREVTDLDGALPVYAKALFIAAAAAVKGHDTMLGREIARAVAGGLTPAQARGAAIALAISRGEAVFERFLRAAEGAFGGLPVVAPAGETPAYEASAGAARDYFRGYFGFVPAYIELMAERAPRALEGYFLMRQSALAENALEAKYVELLLCAVNAAELSSRFVDVHAGGARRAGATEAEVVEAVVCAIPVAGVASWLSGADGIAGRP